MRIALIAAEGDGTALSLGSALERMGHDLTRLPALPEAWLASPPPVFDAHLPWLGARDVRVPREGRLQAALVLEAAGSRPLIRVTTLLRLADRAAALATLRAASIECTTSWLADDRAHWPTGEGPLYAHPRFGPGGVLATSLSAARDAVGVDVAGGGILLRPGNGMHLRLLSSATRTIGSHRWSGDDASGVWDSHVPPDGAASLARRAVAALGGWVMAVDVLVDEDGRTSVLGTSLEIGRAHV